MVYETIKTEDCSDFQLFRSKSANTNNKLRGKCFPATSGSTLRAYEDTHDELPIVTTEYDGFLQAFATILLKHISQNTLALASRSHDDTETWEETKLAGHNATVITNPPGLLPAHDGDICSTNWLADAGTPIQEAKINGQCQIKEENPYHGQHARLWSDDGLLSGMVPDRLMLDGAPVQYGSDTYKVVMTALQILNAA